MPGLNRVRVFIMGKYIKNTAVKRPLLKYQLFYWLGFLLKKVSIAAAASRRAAATPIGAAGTPASGSESEPLTAVESSSTSSPSLPAPASSPGTVTFTPSPVFPTSPSATTVRTSSGETAPLSISTVNIPSAAISAAKLSPTSALEEYLNFPSGIIIKKPPLRRSQIPLFTGRDEFVLY